MSNTSDSRYVGLEILAQESGIILSTIARIVKAFPEEIDAVYIKIPGNQKGRFYVNRQSWEKFLFSRRIQKGQFPQVSYAKHEEVAA